MSNIPFRLPLFAGALLVWAGMVSGAAEAPAPEAPKPPVAPAAPVAPAPAPSAPEAAKGLTLSVEECLEIALQNNLGLRLSQIQDRSVDYDLTNAWAKYMPTLSGGLTESGSSTQVTPVGTSAKTNTVGLTNSVTQKTPWGTTVTGTFAESDVLAPTGKGTSLGVSATQPLWRGRSTEVNMSEVHQARIRKLISRGQLELSLQGLIYTVRSAYTNVIRQMQNLEVNRKAVESSATFLRLTQVREKAGQATKLDVFNAEVQMADRQLAVTTNERDLANALDNLKEIMDVDLEETIKVNMEPLDFGDKAPEGEERVITADEATGVVQLVTRKDGKEQGTPKLMFQAVHHNGETVLNEALANRIDLLNTRRNMALQKINELLARDGLGHQVDLTAGYARSGAGKNWSDSHGFHNDDYSIGVRYSLPWGKITDNTAYERALLALQTAEINMKQARTSVQADVRTQLRSLQAQEKSLLIQAKKVEQDKRLVDAERVRFERGLKDSFDLITAEDRLLSEKVAFINQRLAYQDGLAALEKVVGKATGRVDLTGQTVGGAVKSQLPERLIERGPKRAPSPEHTADENP